MTGNSHSTSSKVSSFKPIPRDQKSFFWKIAILNTIGFCLIAFIDTSSSRFLLSKIEENEQRTAPSMQATNTVNSTIQYSKIEKNNIPRCPSGYWILLCALPLVLGNYYFSRRKHWLAQILSPFLFTVVICWLVSLMNFTPPSPNLWQMWTFAMFPLFGLLSSVIRCYEPDVNFDGVDLKAKIAWITENSQLWRTLGIGSLVPPFVFIAFWWPWAINYTTHTFEDPPLGFFQALWASVAAYIVLYVFIGPIYECFRQADHIRNMLLDINK